LPVVFVSFFVFDSTSAPEFLRTIAEALPLYPLIDGLSGAMVKGLSLSANLSDLGVIAVWSVLGICLAVRGFSWEQRRA
jgi:ABC-2 type transport system permease protein